MVLPLIRLPGWSSTSVAKNVTSVARGRTGSFTGAGAEAPFDGRAREVDPVCLAVALVDACQRGFGEHMAVNRREEVGLRGSGF